ncbi:MAG: PEP/pyruvate-binding domain-containing protein, partial [Candidatus Bilamarchaeaceae archaeon]
MEKKKQLAKNPAEDYGKRQGYKTRLDGCHCYRIFVQDLEKKMSAKLGDSQNPLLVSVRSGAAVSMPGMMDTVLNLGLNDLSVQALIRKTGNERFAWDTYRRFIQMFG